MLPRQEEYHNTIDRLFFRKDNEKLPENKRKRVMTYTFQVTDECNLACTYCYQLSKHKNYMTFETAKQAVDYALEQAKIPGTMFDYNIIAGVVFDFIGGETLLGVPLIEKFIEYTEKRLVEEDSPWLFFHRYSIGSNGVLYFEPNVQHLLERYRDLISIAITIDGTKELHDRCRVFPDGKGSYDLAIQAALAELEKGNALTKLTFCPDNITEVSNGFIHMLELGFKQIHGNCVFEEGWNVNHAIVLYYELKKLADYILDNDLEDHCNIVMFDDSAFCPQDETDNQNYCGGMGKMLAIDYQGNYYPCIRYMESSLNNEQPPVIIGDLSNGPYLTEYGKYVRKTFDEVTRTSQSTEECINCPISRGCSWCSGYNYQKTGSFNKRVTYICVMHKARALANLYFWGRMKKKGKDSLFQNHITEKIALEIISKDEWNHLLDLWR